jgi:hypothetical protein
MKAHKYPWERPGYSFSIDWPPGHVPQPYEKPHPMSKDGDRDLLARSTSLLKGRDALNKLTGRMYYGKNAKHNHIRVK